MARKQLVKGANAARLEERIASVPEDREDDEGQGIFGEIHAMETREDTRREDTRREDDRSEERSRDAPRRQDAEAKLGPGNFTNAEREAIVRCCEDYRNRLPTYLQSVQKELRTIDSVIEKCRPSARGKSK
jgi:hypothetical protein